MPKETWSAFFGIQFGHYADPIIGRDTGIAGLCRSDKKSTNRREFSGSPLKYSFAIFHRNCVSPVQDEWARAFVSYLKCGSTLSLWQTLIRTARAAYGSSWIATYTENDEIFQKRFAFRQKVYLNNRNSGLNYVKLRYSFVIHWYLFIFYTICIIYIIFITYSVCEWLVHVLKMQQ